MTAWPAITSESLHSSVSSCEYPDAKKSCHRVRVSRRDGVAQSTHLCVIYLGCGVLSEVGLVHSVVREER